MNRIRTIKKLKELASADGGFECCMLLNYGVYSVKHISWDGEVFYVHNYIDESHEVMTPAALEIDNIGRAMRRGALVLR